MKKLACLFCIVTLITGCYSIKNAHTRMKNEVENSRRVSESNFNYRYRDVFLAIVQLMNDSTQTIYEKDFDKGIIMVSCSGHTEVAVGCSYGFWLQKIDANKTRVILKINEQNLKGGGVLIGLTVDDLFNMIKNELELRERLESK